MGFMFAVGNCALCSCIFDFNPDRVPSLRGDFNQDGIFRYDPDCPRRPICLSCMETMNRELTRAGLKPFEIPANAYKAEEV